MGAELARLGVVAGCVVAACSSAALGQPSSGFYSNSDSQIDLQFLGNGPGRLARVELDGQMYEIHAGALNYFASNATGTITRFAGEMVGFSPEVWNGVGVGETVRYLRADNVQMPFGPESRWLTEQMSEEQAKSIFNFYDQASQRQYFGGDDWAAAFQIALWELVYDFDHQNVSSHDLSGGRLRVHLLDGQAVSSSVHGIVGELFTRLSLGPQMPRRGLLGAAHPEYRDLMLQVVPLPPAAWAGLAVLGGMAVCRRLRRG